MGVKGLQIFLWLVGPWSSVDYFNCTIWK